MPAGDVSTVEAAIAAARETAKGDDLEAIRRATSELQKASHTLAEQLYQQQSANAANAQGAGGRTNDDVKDGEVVDA